MSVVYEGLFMRSLGGSINRLMLVITLIFLSMAGVLASDIYVTALPAIAGHFHASVSLTQQSLSFYLLSLASFQLVYGPLAKRYGNAKVVFIGFTIFTFSSLMCVYADSLPSLIVFRFLQAVGACSGMVISLAFVGSIFDKQNAANILSIIFPFVAISTAISPIIGGYLTTVFSWRAPFVFITIFGCITLFLIVVVFMRGCQETTSSRVKARDLFRSYFDLFASGLFLKYILISCCGYVAYFIYFAQSPFIFASFHLQPHEMGYLYSPLALAYMLGNFSANRLLKKVSAEYVMFVGVILFLISGMLMSTFVFVSYKHIPIVMTIYMSILTLGNGMFLPTSVAGAVSRNKKNAGIAASLVGFFQLLLSAIGAGVIGHVTGNKLEAFSIVIGSISVICFITAFYVVKGSAASNYK